MLLVRVGVVGLCVAQLRPLAQNSYVPKRRSWGCMASVWAVLLLFAQPLLPGLVITVPSGTLLLVLRFGELNVPKPSAVSIAIASTAVCVVQQARIGRSACCTPGADQPLTVPCNVSICCLAHPVTKDSMRQCSWAPSCVSDLKHAPLLLLLLWCLHNPPPLPQSVQEQLDDLLDRSPVLALARLKRHKEVAAAAAATAKDDKHRRQIERWCERYWGVRAERDELRCTGRAAAAA